jgi:hypothetical protein
MDIPRTFFRKTVVSPSLDQECYLQYVVNCPEKLYRSRGLPERGDFPTSFHGWNDEVHTSKLLHMP